MRDSYWYKNKPYRVLYESRIKTQGIPDLIASIDIMAHTIFLDSKLEWIDVVIYECLYENPDGTIWVREKKQFYELFKQK